MPTPRVSQHFRLLDRRVQQRIYELRWGELRCSQEEAIPLVLAGCDVIISAPTAGGKTEAAILPTASLLLAPENIAATVLCISPLKALINDQCERLRLLCDPLGIAVHAWHGDVAASRKKRTFQRPSGFVLITPESLEAMFVRHGSAISSVFARLERIIVDEVHSFWGNARGKQLQSLMARLEQAIGRRVPRIALSATLGDMALAAEFLRPGNGHKVEIVRSQFPDRNLDIHVYGYGSSDRTRLIDNLWELRGQNNLVFANSKADVEHYSDLLRRRSEMTGVENEFIPHHAGISRWLRKYTEFALNSQSQPTTAVCTSTLELGVDLGEIARVAQIGPLRSVASFVQRAGRSGRRGNTAIMDVHITAPTITPTTAISGALYEDLVQTIAIIDLGLVGWCEPPQLSGLHLSTLVQQILSAIAQTGGMTATRAWQTLVECGTFQEVNATVFKAVLRSMAERDLITQAPDRTLLLAAAGEKVTRSFNFYAAFSTPREYRLVSDGTRLGSLSLFPRPTAGDLLIFAGQCWRVTYVDLQHRRVSLVSAPDGGTRPARRVRSELASHVRQHMFKVYTDGLGRPYLDPVAREILEEARQRFGEYGLVGRRIVQAADDVLLFTWRGDTVNETLALWLGLFGLDADPQGMYVRVRAPEAAVRKALVVIGRGRADPTEIARFRRGPQREKFDRFLDEDLLNSDFAARHIDVEGARQAACTCAAH